MDLQEIFNLIIAAVPAFTAVVTIFVAFVKIVTSLKNIKHSFDSNTDVNKETINKLKQENSDLKEAIKETQKQFNQLARKVSKVIDKIDIGEKDDGEPKN